MRDAEPDIIYAITMTHPIEQKMREGRVAGDKLIEKLAVQLSLCKQYHPNPHFACPLELVDSVKALLGGNYPEMNVIAYAEIPESSALNSIGLIVEC